MRACVCERERERERKKEVTWLWQGMLQEIERERKCVWALVVRVFACTRVRVWVCVCVCVGVCVCVCACVGVLTFFMGCILYSAKNDKLLLFFFSSVFKKVIFLFEHRHQSIFHRSSLVSKPTVVEIVAGWSIFLNNMRSRQAKKKQILTFFLLHLWVAKLASI